jgi:protein involved in polysaccharide export with SLBB domain
MKIIAFPSLRAAVALVLCGLVSAATLSAQAPAAQPNEAPKAVSYRISPADKLTIAVIGETDLNAANKRVDANGNINLALINDVHVAGLTVAEAQKAIETAYIENRMLRRPQVSINIEEYSPREVNISGMVKNPGKYPLAPETPMTLKDLVLRAGGFQDTANGQKVRITRNGPDGRPVVMVKDIDALIRAKPSANNDGALVLEPGDIVYVPEKII